MELSIFTDSKGFMSFRFLSRNMQIIFPPLLSKLNSFSEYSSACWLFIYFTRQSSV